MSTVMAGYRNSGFFVLRTPLLPLDEFFRLSEGIEPHAEAESEASETATSKARVQLREKMRCLLRLPEVREAILLASPSLEERLEGWLDHPEHRTSRDTELALYRYLVRMCTRPTPFGLFAGLSLGELRAETSIWLQGRDQYTRYTRLDNDYLYMLLQQINESPQFRASAHFFPNNSLYPQAGAFRYVESRVDPNTRAKTYQLVSAQHSEYLELVLERAKEGATRGQLAQAIVARDSDFSLAEASEYIDTLIENQLLISPLDVAVTGREPLDEAIADLQGKAPDAMVDVLRGIRNQLRALDQAGMANPRDRYGAIARELEALPPRDVKLSRLFQVNLRKPVQTAALGKDVVVAVRATLEALYRIAEPPEEGIIEEFKRRFMARYEGRPVPLLDALDEETGIGVEGRSVNAEASPLLEGVDFASIEPAGHVSWRRKEQWLLDKLTGIWESGAAELVLSAGDIRELEVKEKLPLPPAFSATFRIAAAGAEGKGKIVLDGAGGPSGINLLGRFCHESPELTRWVKRHVAEEEANQPDALFAEIVHLPEGRIGNVICRPVLREHEIPYLGRSGVERAKQIPVSDLLVSVVNGRLILTSRRHGREVIPRLSNSHNIYSTGLGVYRFLANLQHHAHTWRLGWDWGTLAGASRLPRVRIGSVVVARQQWTLARAELSRLAKLRDGERLNKATQLRNQHRMARFVAFVDGDNALAVDFANIVSLDAMLDAAKRRPAARFVELWPGSNEGIVRGPEGSFANEFVLPFVKKPGPETQTAISSQSVRQRPGKQVRRSFPPGSEWLYLKLYAGESVIDQLLTESLAEKLERLKSDGLIDRWFFIRYGDPDWHLRMRLHGDPDALHCQVLRTLSDLAQGLVDDGVLSRLVVDTYDRELERYGGAHGIEAAEQLFCIDSEAVLQILVEVLPEGREDARWQLALLGADRLLDDFGFDLAGKATFMARRRRAYAAEFVLEKRQEKQLSKKYRSAREGVERLLAGTYADAALRLGAEILDERSRRFAPLAQDLKLRVGEKQVPTPIEDLVASYIHMFTNRLLVSAARAQELVLYDYLARTYRSQHGRAANH